MAREGVCQVAGLDFRLGDRLSAKRHQSPRTYGWDQRRGNGRERDQEIPSGRTPLLRSTDDGSGALVRHGAFWRPTAAPRLLEAPHIGQAANVTPTHFSLAQLHGMRPALHNRIRRYQPAAFVSF